MTDMIRWQQVETEMKLPSNLSLWPHKKTDHKVCATDSSRQWQSFPETKINETPLVEHMSTNQQKCSVHLNHWMRWRSTCNASTQPHKGISENLFEWITTFTVSDGNVTKKAKKIFISFPRYVFPPTPNMNNTPTDQTTTIKELQYFTTWMQVK